MMQVSTISDDCAAQACIVNRFAGSVRAWAFLVHQGYDYRQVFEFLANMQGPEDAPSPSTCDILRRAGIDRPSPEPVPQME